MREFPEQARARGDYSSAARITDGSLAAIEQRHGQRKAFLERLKAIDVSQLSDDDRLMTTRSVRTTSVNARTLHVQVV